VPARWPVTEALSGVTGVPKPPLYKPVLGPEVNFVGACAKLPRLIRPGSVRARRYLQAVEDVRKLHANVQTAAFPDPEISAEVGALHRYAEASQRADPVPRTARWKRWSMRPGSAPGSWSDQSNGIDVERVGMMNAVEVRPVHGPRAHAGNQLRWARSVAEKVADRR
jgi:hypothetical protein